MLNEGGEIIGNDELVVAIEIRIVAVILAVQPMHSIVAVVKSSRRRDSSD